MLLDQQEPLSTRTGKTTRGVGCNAQRSKHNIVDVLGPEEEPPDTKKNEEDSRSLAETERCPEPRKANRRKRARRTRGSGGGAHVAGRGLVRKLLWRIRPKPGRARHKAMES